MADPRPLDSKPRLVATGDPLRGARREPRSTPGLIWVLAGLIAFSVGAAAVQSERLDRMTARAEEFAAKSEALQAELSQAQARIQSLEAQRGLVRESVADLAERVAALYEIVQPGGSPPPAPRPEPAE